MNAMKKNFAAIVLIASLIVATAAVAAREATRASECDQIGTAIKVLVD